MRNFTGIVLFLALLAFTQTTSAQSKNKDYKSYPYWIDMMQDPDAKLF